MHYIRELAHDEIIAIHYCASSKKVTNIFTKEYFEKTFNNLKSLLGRIFAFVVLPLSLFCMDKQYVKGD